VLSLRFRYCLNNLKWKNGGSLKAGYSVALAILCIVLIFLGLLVYLWLVFRPAPKDGHNQPSGLIPAGHDSSDGYAPASPPGHTLQGAQQGWNNFRQVATPNNLNMAMQAGQAYNQYNQPPPSQYGAGYSQGGYGR
jgi:hypothetical protein